jgi:phosphohistidine phosphatase
MSVTRQLFVLRHAKSSWDDPRLDDHDRPLAPRGQRAVKVLSQHIKAAAIEPSLVLCSTARRTRETLAGVAPPGEALIEAELYGASAGAIVERLRQVHADTDAVMVIGHNPAMQMLVLRLAGKRNASSDDDDLASVERKFPTGALATLTFECEWSELAAGAARLTALVRPKDLNLAPRAPTSS